jgi:2-oxoglutarate dehydrogenase E2 component (dihydrolipoamide succinyltransferase)
MAVELVVPSVGESITEVMIGEWLVEEGGSVQRDQAIVEIESDKATVELNAPSAGTITQVLKKQGDMANVGEVIGYMEEGEAAASSSAPAQEKPTEAKPTEEKPAEDSSPAEDSAPAEKSGDASGSDNGSQKSAPAEETEPEKAEVTAETKQAESDKAESKAESAEGEPRIMPAAQRELDQRGIDASDVEATGPGGRLLKEDVLRHADKGAGKGASKDDQPKETFAASKPSEPQPAPSQPTSAQPTSSQPQVDTGQSRETRTTPITPMRKRIAERLVYAQQSGALLTTFNEIDMSGVMALRKEFQEEFTEKHGIKLGFMSFFIKACVDALKAYPQVNAEMQENQIVYYEYCDIGIAVGGGKGLVVPVIRNAEALGLAGLEKAIADFGKRARENKIKLEELQGGTFSITNGGIFGSLMSTPILNPPQSAILGMHKIQDRPMAVNGEVVIRPMMYVALTYDHRIIDGREAVSFLVRIKENLERPERMLLDL